MTGGGGGGQIHNEMPAHSVALSAESTKLEKLPLNPLRQRGQESHPCPSVYLPFREGGPQLELPREVKHRLCQSLPSISKYASFNMSSGRFVGSETVPLTLKWR